MKNILIISTSMRNKSNSEILAQQALQGALAIGNNAELITMKDKDIRFCKGCLACQKTMKCVIKDDVSEILEKVKAADTVVFVTPIYYYELSGQLKTLLDRLNPLYPQEYSFRDIYLMTTSAEDGDEVVETAVVRVGSPALKKRALRVCSTAAASMTRTKRASGKNC